MNVHVCFLLCTSNQNPFQNIEISKSYPTEGQRLNAATPQIVKGHLKFIAKYFNPICRY